MSDSHHAARYGRLLDPRQLNHEVLRLEVSGSSPKRSRATEPRVGRRNRAAHAAGRTGAGCSKCARPDRRQHHRRQPCGSRMRERVVLYTVGRHAMIAECLTAARIRNTSSTCVTESSASWPYESTDSIAAWRSEQSRCARPASRRCLLPTASLGHRVLGVPA